MVQNNPPNYVTSYETDFYHEMILYAIYIYIYLTAIGMTPGGSGTVHSQIEPLLLLLCMLGAVLIEIGKSGE
jgi:hypothetical protein